VALGTTCRLAKRIIMGYQINQITRSDLPDIQRLYQEIYSEQPHLIKGSDELEWLFSDPHQEHDFLGYIARTPDHEIAGIISYSLNPYKFGDSEFKGIIPVSWMIASAHRGLLGIQLLRQVLKEGNFSFALQGSKEAQRSYKVVKLSYVGAANIYTKVLKPFAYIRSEKDFSLKCLMKTFYYLGRKRCHPSKNAMHLEAGLGGQGIHHSPVTHLTMIPDTNRNHWLSACPLVELLPFTLYHQGKKKGPALCYISLTEGIKRGRILHIPYMGDETESYRQAIGLLEKELAARGCCSVDALAMQSASRNAYLLQGYRTHRSALRNLYVRDPGNLLEGVDLEQWYLTFYESDKGYRGI